MIFQKKRNKTIDEFNEKNMEKNGYRMCITSFLKFTNIFFSSNHFLFDHNKK